MNKIVYYAILAYTIFSGIIATAFAIDYFVTGMSSLPLVSAISLAGINTFGEIASANLTPVQQSNYITMLENFYATEQTIEQQSLANLSFYQFIGYESLFIVPPFILLLVMAYRSKDNKTNNE
jgi:hypothetical protein